MEVVLLGTGASQGVPGVHCACERCLLARTRGGRELRSRTSTLVNGRYLVDAGPDSYLQFVREGLSHRDLAAVFHTHSHDDHFATELHRRRYPVYAGGPIDRTLVVAANKGVCSKLERAVNLERAGIEMRVLQPFDQLAFGDLQVTALPANHALSEGGLLYLFVQGSRRFLCAYDTGYLPDETWEYLSGLGRPLDLVVFDGTWIDENRGDDHMDLKQNVAVMERMRRQRMAHTHARFVLTHIGHFGSMGHAELCDVANSLGLEVGFDGMRIPIKEAVK